MVKVNLQIVTLDVPPQDVITKDNVTVRVNAVCYFQVFEPVKAIVEVQNYLFATSQIAQTTLRAVLSKVELDHDPRPSATGSTRTSSGSSTTSPIPGASR